MNIFFAHTGHEHATTTNAATHHLPALIAFTVALVMIAAVVYWQLTKPTQEKASERNDEL